MDFTTCVIFNENKFLVFYVELAPKSYIVDRTLRDIFIVIVDDKKTRKYRITDIKYKTIGLIVWFLTFNKN